MLYIFKALLHELSHLMSGSEWCLMVWSSESFCMDCLTPPCDTFAPRRWGHLGASLSPPTPQTAAHLLFVAAVLFENNFFKLSAQTMFLTLSPQLISLDSFNAVSNSSGARKKRARGIFNVKRDSEYKTPTFAKNQFSKWCLTRGKGRNTALRPLNILLS